MSLQPAIGTGPVSTPTGLAQTIADLRRRLAQMEAQGTIIRAGSITGAQIGENAITAQNIAAGAISAIAIVAGSITTNHVAAGAITAELIAAGAVVAGHIAANAIQTNHIQAGAITAGLIAADAIQTNHIQAGAVTAGTVAAGAITSSTIAADSITSTHIAAGAVGSEEIFSGAVTSDKIFVTSLAAISAQLGSITSGTITGATVQTSASGARVVLNTAGINAYNASGTPVLAFDTSTGNLTLTGTVTANASSVVPVTALSGQVTGNQIADGAITTGKILATEINGDTIFGQKITANKMSVGTLSAITADMGALTAGTITGATVQTSSATGARVVFDASGVKAYNASNVNTFTLSAGDGSVTATGGTFTGATFQTAASSPRMILDSAGLRFINSAGTTTIELAASATAFKMQSNTDTGFGSFTVDSSKAVMFTSPYDGSTVGWLYGLQYAPTAPANLANVKTVWLRAGHYASLGAGDEGSGRARAYVEVGQDPSTSEGNARIILWNSAGNATAAYRFNHNNFNFSRGGLIQGDLSTSPGTMFAADGMYTANWFRSYGATGWYAQDHGIGLFAQDSDWVRTYGSLKSIVGGYMMRGEYFLSIGGTGVVGGLGMGAWWGSGASTYVYSTRSDWFGQYQDHAMGGLYAGGSVKANPVDDLAGLIDTRADDVLEPGELVCIDTDVEYEDGWEENYFRVRRATAADADRVLGVLSSRSTARLMMGTARWGRDGTLDIEANADWRKLIAYAGVIPTKVTMENGKILAGDRLCMGNEPGRAMRATEPGHVIGVALRDCDRDGEVIMLVAPGWWAGKPQKARVAKKRTRRRIPVEPMLMPKDWRDSIVADTADNDYGATPAERKRITRELEELEQHLVELHAEWENQQQVEETADAVAV